MRTFLQRLSKGRASTRGSRSSKGSRSAKGSRSTKGGSSHSSPLGRRSSLSSATSGGTGGSSSSGGGGGEGSSFYSSRYGGYGSGSETDTDEEGLMDALDLTEEQYHAFKGAFELVDENRNGVISLFEMAPITYMLQSSADGLDDVNRMLDAADLDEDGVLSLEEFMTVLKRAQDAKYRLIYELFHAARNYVSSSSYDSSSDDDDSSDDNNKSNKGKKKESESSTTEDSVEVSDNNSGTVDPSQLYITEDELGRVMMALGRVDYADSEDTEIGMFDEVQLVEAGVSPEYIRMVIADEGDERREELLKRYRSGPRGKITLAQFAKYLGYSGKVTALPPLKASAFASDLEVEDSDSCTLDLNITNAALVGMVPKNSETESTPSSNHDYLSYSFVASETERAFSVAIEEFYIKRTFSVLVSSSSTLQTLLNKIAKVTGQPLKALRVYYRGFQLLDPKVTSELTARNSLQDFGIGVDAKLTVLYHPRELKLKMKDAWPAGKGKKGGKKGKGKGKGKGKEKVVRKSQDLDVAAIYEQFMFEGRLTTEFAMTLIAEARKRIMKLDSVLDVRGPVTIVGDIHGQFYDLPNILATGGPIGEAQYLFLGDYIDRGYFSAETALFLLSAFVRYPGKVHLLRGNHESPLISAKPLSGTKDEVEAKYSADVYESLIGALARLPAAAVVTVPDGAGGERRLFCAHGGIDRIHPTVESMREVKRNRKKEVRGKGLMRGVMWDDPHADLAMTKREERALAKSQAALSGVLGADRKERERLRNAYFGGDGDEDEVSNIFRKSVNAKGGGVGENDDGPRRK